MLRLFTKQVKSPIKNSTIKQTQVEPVFLLVSFAFASWERKNTYKNNAWEENIRIISAWLCTHYTGLFKDPNKKGFRDTLGPSSYNTQKKKKKRGETGFWF